MTKIKLATEKFVYDLTIFNAALDICPNHDKHEDNWLVPADYIFSLVVETPEIEINVYPRVHFARYLEISGDIRVTYGKLPVGTYHLRTHAEVSDPGNYFVAYYGSSFDVYRGDTRIYPGTLL